MTEKLDDLFDKAMQAAAPAPKTATPDPNWVHPFEVAGLGKAPFRFESCETKHYQACPGAPMQPGSSCDFCGTGIVEVFWLRSRDGRRFKVGCDCVLKTTRTAQGDAEKKLVTQVKRQITLSRKVATEARTDALLEWYDRQGRTWLSGVPHPKPERARKGETYASMVDWFLEHAGAKGSREVLVAARKAYEKDTGETADIRAGAKPRKNLTARREEAQAARPAPAGLFLPAWGWKGNLVAQCGKAKLTVHAEGSDEYNAPMRLALSAPYVPALLEDIRTTMRGLQGYWDHERKVWVAACRSEADVETLRALAERLGAGQAARAASEGYVAAPLGRVTFEGEILKVEHRESKFGLRRKATIKVSTPAGIWLAWGSLPLMDDERGVPYDIVAGKGDRVQITATCEAGSDAHFALFSRPTGAKLLGPRRALTPEEQKKKTELEREQRQVFERHAVAKRRYEEIRKTMILVPPELKERDQGRRSHPHDPLRQHDLLYGG